MTYEIIFDEEEGILTIDGNECEWDGDHVNIPRWMLEEIKVQDLPFSLPVQAVIRVLGGSEEYNNDGITITNEEDGPYATISDAIMDPAADGYFRIESDYLDKEHIYLVKSLNLAAKEGIVWNQSVSDINEEGYFHYSYCISIPNSGWTVVEAIEYAENFNSQRAVISENPESLLNVLHLIKDSDEKDTKTFSREYLPMVSTALVQPSGKPQGVRPEADDRRRSSETVWRCG